MSVLSNGTSSRLTPKHRLYPSYGPSKAAREDGGLHLNLKTVVGTTTASPNGFDSLPEQNEFVCCAGPAVILSIVDEHLNISQRLFCARPSTAPINATPSFYNPSTPPTTPGKSRQGSPLKDNSHGMGLAASLEYIPDSPSNSKSNSRNREVTCVSMSRAGQILAVGETGYNPRVLLFSTVSDAPSDIPLAVITDHSYGVQSVAFSNDSRWLCSLGNTYDGFMLLYSINLKTGSARLHSSNKCSNVRTMAWMGNSVITVGTRHAKVWRVERPLASPAKGRPDTVDSTAGPPGSPAPRTFSGRNCLLGPLIDATFNCVAAVSDCKAILCTSQGEICLLDDSDKMQRLTVVAQVKFGIFCVYFDQGNQLIWFGGKDRHMEAMAFENLIQPMASPLSPTSLPTLASSSASCLGKRACVLAIGSVRDRIITCNSERIVEIRRIEKEDGDPSLSVDCKRLPAHESAVLGVCNLLYRPDDSDPSFLTFSAKGTVLLWLFDGTCAGRIEVPLEQRGYMAEDDENELKIMASSDFDELLLSGDKLGVLRIIDRDGSSSTAVQAHKGEINGIAIARRVDNTLVVSCSRDRTVQVFMMKSRELSLLQTLDDHAAAVGDVMFMDEASTLLSMSSDRTIIVRKIALREGRSMAFIPIRVITLKASPVSFVAVPWELNTVFVSSMDKQVQKYDTSSGRLLHTFKASDPVTNDTVLMNSLEMQNVGDEKDQRLLLFGFSSTDRSIRVYDCDKGLLLAKEQGHSAVSAIKIVQQRVEGETPLRHLVSCGLNGTVMVFEVGLALQQTKGTDSPIRSESPLKSTPPVLQPLRRILSKAEISDFRRSLEDEGETITAIRSPSPSRIRRKTSKYNLANPPRTNPASLHSIKHASNTDCALREATQNHSPTSTSPKAQKLSKIKRPSADHRLRSKSAANLNDLNDSARQICMSLRMFRKRVASSVADKLEHETGNELELELELTLRAMSEKTKRIPASSEPITGDLLDTYLAKMIDERLALTAKPGETVHAIQEAQRIIEAEKGPCIDRGAEQMASSEPRLPVET